MRKQLTALRRKMKERGIDIYIIPTTDYHGSEYVNDYFKCREYISGFTGSAGTLIVKQDFAGMLTDGRYFLQARQQLEGSGITLMAIGERGVPSICEYLSQMPSGSVVGFDGRIVSSKLGESLEGNYNIVYDIDLVEEIWEDRPDVVPSKIYSLPPEVTGESSESKLVRVREQMGSSDFFLVSRLEDIAWLYNLRGRDIEHTPVFYAFALISKNSETLYVMDEEYIMSSEKGVRPYKDVFSDMEKLRNCAVILDEDSVSYAVSKCFHSSVERILRKSPVERLKAVKNKNEISATKNAHIRDGAVMIRFLYWLKNSIGTEKITEISLADKLEKLRREQGAYDLSFDTIAGYEEHGAVIHYSATEESNAVLREGGFILIDSGGQYEDGTTDITRTIALGNVDDERKRNYTAVLKGHIALATAQFTEDTTGADLDLLARKPLREAGLDFKHGTGHGVGHMLSVHEGPNNISPRSAESHIIPGMITSDEPGVYLEGEYGIRIENELLCIEKDGKYVFETITLCPYERDAIDISMLTEDEIRYINRYHAFVEETLSPLLDEPERVWLKRQCKDI